MSLQSYAIAGPHDRRDRPETSPMPPDASVRPISADPLQPQPRSAFVPAVIPQPTPALPYRPHTCVVCGESCLARVGQPRGFCLPCLQSPARRARIEAA